MSKKKQKKNDYELEDKQHKASFSSNKSEACALFYTYVFICVQRPTVMEVLAYICTHTCLRSAVMSSEDTLPHFHLEPAMWAGCLCNAAMKQKNLISYSLLRNNVRPALILKTHLRRVNRYAARLSRLCRDTVRRAHDRR